MSTNAIVHLQTHPNRVRNYSEKVTKSLDELKSRTDLYTLIQKGPSKLNKSPSSLAFIANADDAYLPNDTHNEGSWSKSAFGSSIKSNWWLSYGSVNTDATDIRPQGTQIDWVFIITYLLSLLPLLFTFDSFSGEREQGTLRLCLANQISRSTLLIGKYIGALIAVLIPFTLSVLLNLAVISTDSLTQLNLSDWSRLGIILLIAASYAGIFIGLGLMVSAGTSQSRISLIIVLLIWVSIVVFVPSTFATLSTKWMPPIQTNDELQSAKNAALHQNDSDYFNNMRKIKENKNSEQISKIQKQMETDPEAAKAAAEKIQVILQKDGPEELKLNSEFVKKDVEIRESSNRTYLDAQITQIQRARSFTRFSPAAIVQYALESMAGTGFNRHLQFLEHVHRYTKQFRQFIIDTDREDTQSLHLIGISDGMSKKPIAFESIPKFDDKITFQNTLNSASLDLLLLILLLVLFFSGAFLVFLRTEV